MSTIEDRLTRALAARADLVQPTDLREATPVSPPPSLLRRPATYLLAAAACAAAVALPFVVDGDGAHRPAPPPTTQGPEPTPPAEVEGADWPEVYSYPRAYDLDADGVPDEVVVRTEVDAPLPAGTRRVEAHLSTGGVAAVLLDYDTYDLTMVEPVELDGEPGHEVLYYRGTEAEEMGVLELRDGALVDLAVPDEPGLTSNLDELGRLRSRWVEDGSLYSSRSVEQGFTYGDGGKRVPKKYGVDVWRWSLVDGALVPLEETQRCMESPGQDHPVPCTEPALS